MIQVLIGLPVIALIAYLTCLWVWADSPPPRILHALSWVVGMVLVLYSAYIIGSIVWH